MPIEEKPPLGLTPKYIHDSIRMSEIYDAIIRYKQAGKLIPIEWLEEFNELCGY